jgi:phospholipid/cholesterol/gamma-HCH transport system permease protein
MSALQKYILIPVEDSLTSIGQYVLMVLQVLSSLFSNFPKKDLIATQLYEMGVRSLPLVCSTGMATGMVLAAQSFFQLSDKGLTGATGVMVAKSMLDEIGPILTAFIITGRVGAAICAELGSMKVTEQVDAIKCMGINPLSYLVAPRYVAMGIMMPILTIFSAASGIFGGWFIATSLYGMASQAYLEPIQVYLTTYDLVTNFLKSWIFGLLVVSVSCYKGLSTTGGAAGVGRATTSSVVVTYTLVLAVNFVLTILLNAIYWYVYGFQ